VSGDLLVKFIFELCFLWQLTYNGSEIPLPFNLDIVNWAIETKRILQTAKLPEGVKFYNLFGTSFDTPFHAWFHFSPSFWWQFFLSFWSIEMIGASLDAKILYRSC
jgi:hypothetical protein